MSDKYSELKKIGNTSNKKKSIFSYAASKEKKDDGVWCDIYGMSFLLRSANSVKYLLAVKDVAARENIDLVNFTSSDMLNMSEKLEGQMHDFMVETFIEGMLIDWREVYDEGGKIVEFSKENAISVFSPVEMGDFLGKILEASKNEDLYLAEFQGSAEKN